MERVTVIVKAEEGLQTGVRVPVIKRFGSLVLHRPHDDYMNEFLTLTHAKSGRTVLEGNFVIDARLPLPMLTPVLTEIAALFPDDAATMTATMAAVRDALCRVIENMEKLLLADETRS